MLSFQWHYMLHYLDIYTRHCHSQLVSSLNNHRRLLYNFDILYGSSYVSFLLDMCYKRWHPMHYIGDLHMPYTYHRSYNTHYYIYLTVSFCKRLNRNRNKFHPLDSYPMHSYIFSYIDRLPHNYQLQMVDVKYQRSTYHFRIEHDIHMLDIFYYNYSNKVSQ